MLEELKKINFLVTKNQRIKILILSVLIFIGMIFEALGLGLFIPILSFLLDPENIGESPLMRYFSEFHIEYSYKSFVFILLGLIVTVYFIKTLFLIYLMYKQNLFISNLTAYLANNLYNKYMNQSFSFHKKRNSSELIKNIQVEINYLSAYLNSLLVVFTEFFFTISILGTLIYIDATSAISVIIFYGFLSGILMRFTKNRLQIWGGIRQKLDEQSSKIVLEGLGGFKELFILDKLSFFTEKFTKTNYAKVRLNANQATLSQIPRFYLEFISLLGLTAFISINLYYQKDPKSIMVIMGLFVAATFKIIPSISKIIASFQSMNFFKASVNVVYNEMISTNETKKETDLLDKFTFQDKIQFKHINFSFVNEKEILKDCNLTINKGQIIGIKGESGSGKTTLIDLLLGLYQPISGNIFIDGIIDFPMYQSWRNNIGYVSQSTYLIDDTIKNNIALGTPEENIDESRIYHLLRQVQLEKFINNLEKGINTKVGERGTQLSGGQLQRIGIARALYNNPDILIFDEATSALDSFTEKEVIDAIYNLKDDKTIIIIAHRLDTLKSCDIVYNIENGKAVLI